MSAVVSCPLGDGWTNVARKPRHRTLRSRARSLLRQHLNGRHAGLDPHRKTQILDEQCDRLDAGDPP